MNRFRFQTLWIAFAVIASVGLASIAAEPKADSDGNSGQKSAARLLFVSQSFEFKHDVVNRKAAPKSVAERTMEELGVGSGLFRADCTQDVAKDLTKENLQHYDMLMFYTTGHRAKWPIDDAALDYIFTDWVKQKGHGFIGVHSAADTLEDYEPYWQMLGGSFNGHPWTANSRVTVVVHDPDHPIAKPWGNEFPITDEIYQFKHWQPDKVRVLMSLDLGRSAFNKQVKENIKQYHVPIAWCKEFGDGKVFHMSLGHNEAVWLDQRYRDSLLGGIKWILGLEPGSAKPNPEIEAPLVEKGKADVAAKITAFSVQEKAIAQIEMIDRMCMMYRRDMDSFPLNLDSLFSRPATPNADKWAGPYIDRPLPPDPWNNAYRYQYPGTKHGNTKPDIWSLGPDGGNGTDDDIYNR